LFGAIGIHDTGNVKRIKVKSGFSTIWKALEWCVFWKNHKLTTRPFVLDSKATTTTTAEKDIKPPLKAKRWWLNLHWNKSVGKSRFLNLKP
jgi:hypothetical protein